jgi:acyl carrier protein
VTTTPANLHHELKLLIVEALQLEDVDPASISDTAPLFGAGLEDGLELDSIDALELATAIARKYDVEVNQDQETRDAFRSVAHLAEFIALKRAAAGARASRAG